MSREAERIASRFRPPYKQVIETFSGPSSYVAGGTVHHSKLLRHVERAACLQGVSGWIGEAVTGKTSGNAFTLLIWTATATQALQQPDAAADLSAASFTMLLEGL